MTRRITVTLETRNAAFDDGNAGAECARILQELAEEFASGHADAEGLDVLDGYQLRDINGNRVGEVRIK